MSEPDIIPIIVRANLPEHIADQLIKRRAELEPVVSTQVDSLLILADHDVDAAIALALKQIDILKGPFEGEPSVSTDIGSLLIMADQNVDLAIGLAMMQVEILIAIKARNNVDARTQ